MRYLLEEGFTSASTADISPYSASSIPLLSSFSSIFRSSFPLQVLTTVLQTALTSAPKMTALLSSWKQGPAVPVHARASTAAVAASAEVTAAAVLAARSRPKWKCWMSLMILHPATLQQLRVSPQNIQQRAAAARRLLPRRKKRTERVQGCDAQPSPAVVTGHKANCCVFY